MIDVVYFMDDFVSFILDGIWSKEIYDGFGQIWDVLEENKIGIVGYLKGLWYVFFWGDGLIDGVLVDVSLEEKVVFRE